MESDTQKIIILGGAVLVCLAGVLFLLISNLLQEEDTTVPTVTPFPTGAVEQSVDGGSVTAPLVTQDTFSSTTATEFVLPFVRESDWQDSVVEYQIPTVTQEEYQATALQPETEALEIENEGVPPLPVPSSEDETVVSEDMAPVASLVIDVSAAAPCGQVYVPSTAEDYETFITELSKERVVECMGKKLARNCTPAKTEVQTPFGLSTTVYVAELSDGTCATGVLEGDGSINMCSVAESMNAFPGDNNDMEEWQDEFKDNPGDLFAKLYLEADPVVLADVRCELYGVKE